MARDASIRFAGATVVLGGIVWAILGIIGLIDVIGQPMDARSATIGVLGAKEAETVTEIARILWGVLVLTAGRYVYRAAGKRGVRDRLGRLLIIFGYAVIVFGMTRAVSYGMAESIGGFAVNMFGFGVAGAIAVAIGVGLSDEDPLLMVNFGVSTRTGR